MPISTEPSLSTRTSAPTTTSTSMSALSPITLFVGRFGTIYLNREPIKFDAVVSTLTSKNVSRKSIVLLYDPISLEVDRQRLFQMLRIAFPESQIVFRTAEGEEYAQWLFPANETEVLELIVSQQNLSSQSMESRPKILMDQIESYLMSIAARSNQIHSDITSFEQGYQHLTTRKCKECCR